MTNTITRLKLLAGIAGLTLIAGILFIANSFVGNPISAAFANRAIKEYTAQNYADLELKLNKAHYNFKFGGYWAKAESPTSQDTHFEIYYRNGKVLNDNYQAKVLGKNNTLSRFEDEYTQLVIPILAEIPGLENNRAMVQIDKWEYEKNHPGITLDMLFNKTLPIGVNLMVRAELSDTSLAKLADLLEIVHQTMLENGCVFVAYDIFSERDDTLVMINHVTPSDMESGELEQRLQAALNYKDEDLEKIQPGDEKSDPDRRLTVFIKTGDSK